MNLRKVIWLGNTRNNLKTFPSKVKDEIGHSIYLAQTGKKSRNAKQMKGISPSVMEIISDYDTNTYRAIYTIKLGEYIYILHCFNKKSKSGIKTPQKEINLIKQRLRLAKEHWLSCK